MNRRFCVAPMMERTDRHFRFFLRLISRHALLYTEMITASALIHGDRGRLLAYDPHEHPVALQLGGSHPEEMSFGAALAQEAGYDEVNINVGCPSGRVQSGRIGACLMAEPETVADCVWAISRRVDVPISVKTRIGVDLLDSYDGLNRFVSVVAEAGCNILIVHARKAWLKGLSPKQNRDVPPLRYDVVYRLKRDFPQLQIIINGGITTLSAALSHLDHVDGVMLGRAIYNDPYMITDVDRLFFADLTPTKSRREILEEFRSYLETQISLGVPMVQMLRHIVGLYRGIPGARRWRRVLSEQPHGSSTHKDIFDRIIANSPDREPITHVV